MLPAEMAHIADRTRAREEEEDGEEDPPVQLEIILPQGIDGDNPPVILERKMKMQKIMHID